MTAQAALPLESLEHPVEFDARGDADSCLRHRLGLTPRRAAYLPAMVAACLAGLPVIGVIGGLILFGLPPLSALGGFLSLLVPSVVLLGFVGYYVRKARAQPAGFPERYTMDDDGVYFEQGGKIRDLIEWDSPRLFVIMADMRPFKSFVGGTTLIYVGGGAALGYPVPAEMFDRVIRTAHRLGLAGPSRQVTTGRGKIVRTDIRATPR